MKPYEKARVFKSFFCDEQKGWYPNRRLSRLCDVA